MSVRKESDGRRWVQAEVEVPEAAADVNGVWPIVVGIVIAKRGADPTAVIARVKEVIESHRKEIRTTDLELAAFVCVTSMEALTHTAVLHHDVVSDAATDALIDDATRMIVGYLTG